MSRTIKITFDDEREPTLGEMILLAEAGENEWGSLIELIMLRSVHPLEREDLEELLITEACKLLGDLGDSLNKATAIAVERVRETLPVDEVVGKH